MDGSLEVRIPRFILKYRVTSQSTTGTAPAELLMGRRIRTHLDSIQPRNSESGLRSKLRNRTNRKVKVEERIMA